MFLTDYEDDDRIVGGYITNIESHPYQVNDEKFLIFHLIWQ